MTAENAATEQFGALQPVVLLFCTDLMFGVQLQNMVRKAGLRAVNVKPGAPLPPGDLLVVDLAARADWDEPIKAAVQRGTRVVAFGPHMDAAARRRAKDAGAWRVLANSNLQRDLPAILLALRQDDIASVEETGEHP